MRCCVKKCKNDHYLTTKNFDRQIKYHRFPTSKSQADEWIEAIGEDKTEFYVKNKRICSIHFQPECFSENNDLLHSATPSLFLNDSIKLTNEELNCDIENNNLKKIKIEKNVDDITSTSHDNIQQPCSSSQELIDNKNGPDPLDLGIIKQEVIDDDFSSNIDVNQYDNLGLQEFLVHRFPNTDHAYHKRISEEDDINLTDAADIADEHNGSAEFTSQCTSATISPLLNDPIYDIEQLSQIANDIIEKNSTLKDQQRKIREDYYSKELKILERSAVAMEKLTEIFLNYSNQIKN